MFITVTDVYFTDHHTWLVIDLLLSKQIKHLEGNYQMDRLFLRYLV